MTTATITLPTGPSEQPQCMTALQRANEVRLARAELKRQIGAGKITVGQVVLSVPWEAASMTVYDLLMAQKRWGRTRTRKFLSAIPLTESKTVGSLTDRQRNAIVAALPTPPPKPTADSTPDANTPEARNRLAGQMASST